MFELWIIMLVLAAAVCVYYDSIEYYVLRDPVLEDLRDKLSVLHPRFRSIVLYEGNRSYTINKKKVYICLKDRNGEYYDRNMLVYVICHEYAHILNKEIGHGTEFQEIFAQLLQKASALGLYDPSIPPVKDYCGHL